MGKLFSNALKTPLEKMWQSTKNLVTRRIIRFLKLKADSDEMKKLGITHNPAITINGSLYRGDLDGPDIFEAICSTFKSRKLRPNYCNKTFDI